MDIFKKMELISGNYLENDCVGGNEENPLSIELLKLQLVREGVLKELDRITRPVFDSYVNSMKATLFTEYDIDFEEKDIYDDYILHTSNKGIQEKINKIRRVIEMLDNKIIDLEDAMEEEKKHRIFG
ncbi:hypothetical protein SAMN02745751_00999 [Dethiosulfatibacter aminovorans DSM 17477]|uniref:Uncharacterized protein n=1 Tax=Dethiosulfatibacter aminovorans DSM 17477 TaxID=1121476 RepID=A0A1M6DQJ6_9FIRM|nr:hypothetical protein [Dethiosulfatibacter aminovorans]SHI75248.1 hypothetical protein SAMN02745751_00999 [Dethiosulfatibacter aminovorans DSM 17477]